MPSKRSRGRGEAPRGRLLARLVDPQAGTVALVALLLGIANGGYEVWQLSRGPSLDLLPPEQLLILPEAYPSGWVFVRFAMRASYINRGPASSSGIVLRETFSYTIGGRKFEQHWQSFEVFTGNECKLESRTSDDVRPVVVRGQDSASHVTYFAPRRAREGAEPYREFHTVEDFIEDVKAADGRVEVQVTTENEGLPDLSTVCSVQLSAHELDLLSDGCFVSVACLSEAGHRS